MNKIIGNLNLRNFLEDLEKSGLTEMEYSFQPLLSNDESGGKWVDSSGYIVGFIVNDKSKFNILLDLSNQYEKNSLCSIVHPSDNEVLEDRIALDFLVRK